MRSNYEDLLASLLERRQRQVARTLAWRLTVALTIAALCRAAIFGR